MISLFQSQVYKALLQIPHGKVVSYGALADFIGCKSAQAIGQALTRNPYDPLIPCHRVIRSDLTLGGYAGGGQAKRNILAQEGVVFDEEERLIDMDNLHRFSSSPGLISNSWGDVTRWLLTSMIDVLTRKDTVTIALSGGSSLDGWYEWCLKNLPAGERGLSQTRWCMIDERIVPVDHADRNERDIMGKFLTPMVTRGLLKISQWIGAGDMPHASHYWQRIGEIDIALMGVGPDGHIASLFPDHANLRDTAQGYITLHDSPKPPSDRISVSVSQIKKIPHTALCFVGENKRNAWNMWNDSTVDQYTCPAKILNPDLIYSHLS